MTKFAEMKPDELLKATQEAVGGDEMVSTAPHRIGSDRIALGDVRATTLFEMEST